MASTPINFLTFSVLIILPWFHFHIINVEATTTTTSQTKSNLCNETNMIKPGSTLSPTSNNPSSWQSPSGLFHFGFYSHPNGFSVGIWLLSGDQKTVVWTANRDDPPLTSNSTLLLDKTGKILVKENEVETLLIRDSEASSACLLDSGNLVLVNNEEKIVWESFDHPTDTILQGQALRASGSLISNMSQTDHSTGMFRLKMQEDGNLVLYPKNSVDVYVDAYWASDTSHTRGVHNFLLFLNATGRMYLVNTTSSSKVKDLAFGGDFEQSSTVIFRATVDFEGYFRVYSHVWHDRNGSGKGIGEARVTKVWQKPDKACDVKGFCGLNSYCTVNDGKPDCVCVPGTGYEGDRGCVRNETGVRCSSGGKGNERLYEMERMENTRLQDFPYFEFKASSEEECSESCLQDCNCEAAFFDSKKTELSCRKQRFPLRYVRRDYEYPVTTFIKVNRVRNATSFGNGTFNSVSEHGFRKLPVGEVLALSFGFVLFSCLALVITGFYVVKIRILRYKRLREDGALGLNSDDHVVILRVFSYNDLKRATKGFKEELGKGSFGAVYKGSLNKGKKLVAVKRLEKLVEEGEKEFQAEMRAIGRSKHKNLVRLLGYCSEGSKRLLVYEYMSNGSLADLLFKHEIRVNWEERVRIAMDVAKGILYLHEGCRNPIIHCDIKPQNILMDEFWTAKISDFGLAKLLMSDQTRTLTRIRGTRGYLAPEWHKNTPISVKADVYSFGIVLLEIVCCRRSMEVNTLKPEEIVLADWAYECFVGREMEKLVDCEDVDKKTMENMVKVALWCIQDQPTLRPSMKSVVLMLQGITEVAIPPCPTAT